MSSTGDDDTEMSRRHNIDDATIEALLTGHDADEDLTSVMSFVEDVRITARGPVPVPSAQLATMLVEGFSTEKGDLLVTAASNVPGPARQAAGPPKWRKTVIGFIAGLSIATKAALGIGVAAAGVTAAGAAGALPEPAEDAVGTVVEAVTPFSFGKKVSADARDGGVDAKAVSEDAKHNGQARRPASPDDVGRPAEHGQHGQHGLDRANQTPASGHAPTSVPAGRPATTPGGEHTAETAAAGHRPDSVPAGPAAGESHRPGDGGSDSGRGLRTADDTAAGSHVPGAVPPAHPTGRS